MASPIQLPSMETTQSNHPSQLDGVRTIFELYRARPLLTSPGSAPRGLMVYRGPSS